MPPQATDDEDEILELTEDQQLNPDDDNADQTDDDSAGGADGDDVEGGNDDGDPNVNDEDDEETLVSFGDAPAEVDQEGDSSTIRTLRRELREAKAKLRETEKPTPAKRELRPEPTSEDHAFDEDAFKADYKAWLAEKDEIEREEATANEARAEIDRQWQADVARFEEQRSKLGFADLSDAQEAVHGALSLAQQAAVVKAAENPALLFYALGKSPAKLAELAKITDVIKFAAAVAKMEGTVKVTKQKRNRPNIDTPQRGSAPMGNTSDKKLEKLEEEAARTGDRTKVIAHKKDMAKRAKK